MHQKITIALDMMSGDHGLSASVPGAIKSLKEHDDLFLMLIGDEKLILPLIPDDFKNTQKKRYSIIHTTEYIAMDDEIIKAIRSKRNSSMRLGINAVKNKDAGACVSAGIQGL